MGRGAAAALVMVALGYIPYHVYARSGLARTLVLRRDLRGLRARNAELAAENERLAHEAEFQGTAPRPPAETDALHATVDPGRQSNRRFVHAVR